MLKIYGAPHSRAFRVIWLANEIGIPYEHIPVTFSVPNAQCKEPWYLALNSNGLVPAIDDSGFVRWETAAINLYLAETYMNSLYPSTPQGRGRMLQWTLFAVTEIEHRAAAHQGRQVPVLAQRRQAAIVDDRTNQAEQAHRRGAEAQPKLSLTFSGAW